MRINVEVEEERLLKAMRLSGMKTYKAALHEALTALIELYEHGEVRNLRGKLHRPADLHQDRRR
ncbi:MAG: type II toxin-antitoxin system VapB family antitoxin [Thermoanaerobaculia bacterium]